MCNRFRGPRTVDDLPAFFNIGTRLNFAFNPNVAPTEMTPSWLAHRDNESNARMARFGILLDGPKPFSMMNTRLDKLQRGSFRKLLENQRCVIPALGFYEWREEQGRKQPYYFYRKDDKPILFAGIWNYSEIKGDSIPSFSIVTGEPNKLVAPYHDRMPLVLDDYAPWIAFEPLDEITPLALESFAVRPVNPEVNKVSTKDITLIERPVNPENKQLF